MIGGAGSSIPAVAASLAILLAQTLAGAVEAGIRQERVEFAKADYQPARFGNNRSRGLARLKGKYAMYHIEIHAKGRINPSWSDWFGELQMLETSGDETILTGQLPDMAAVYGVISRLGSLVIPLVSVNCRKVTEAPQTALDAGLIL